MDGGGRGGWLTLGGWDPLRLDGGYNGGPASGGGSDDSCSKGARVGVSRAGRRGRCCYGCPWTHGRVNVRCIEDHLSVQNGRRRFNGIVVWDWPSRYDRHARFFTFARGWLGHHRGRDRSCARRGLVGSWCYVSSRVYFLCLGGEVDVIVGRGRFSRAGRAAWGPRRPRRCGRVGHLGHRAHFLLVSNDHLLKFLSRRVHCVCGGRLDFGF